MMTVAETKQLRSGLYFLPYGETILSQENYISQFRVSGLATTVQENGYKSLTPMIPEIFAPSLGPILPEIYGVRNLRKEPLKSSYLPSHSAAYYLE